jgi:hypothetical protein
MDHDQRVQRRCDVQRKIEGETTVSKDGENEVKRMMEIAEREYYCLELRACLVLWEPLAMC